MLLDTSGLFLYLQGDHDALLLFEASGRKFTHSHILSELVALAQVRGLPRQSTLRFVEAIIEHPNIEVVWVDEALHIAAMHLLQRRLDKSYSLCDAISFMIMRDRGVSEALTTDHHFAQEGFICLL